MKDRPCGIVREGLITTALLIVEGSTPAMLTARRLILSRDCQSQEPVELPLRLEGCGDGSLGGLKVSKGTGLFVHPPLLLFLFFYFFLFFRFFHFLRLFPFFSLFVFFLFFSD